MQSDAEILALIRRVFSNCPRPEHFTDYSHCPECLDHENLLRSHDLETLRLEHVGNCGWDPICFATPEAFSYYFPALARLALSPPEDFYGWYAWQLLFHLNMDGAQNRHLQHFTPAQRKVVGTFLGHLAETRSDFLENHYCTEDFSSIMDTWFPTQQVA